MTQNTFYTSVTVHRGKILERGYENGRRVEKMVPYKPFLFVRSNSENPQYRTHRGGPLDMIRFESIREAREFIDEYKDVSGFPIYGMTNWVYPYIYETYKGELNPDLSLVRTYFLDIEVAADEGFPNIQTADKPITAIAVHVNGKYTVFAVGEYTGTEDYFEYVQCKTERELLERFVSHFRMSSPDIITGWNIEMFDVPYLVNRITRVIDRETAAKLSPWEVLQEKTVEIWGKEMQVYLPSGMALLDYLQLYRKFVLQMQESYKLDYIVEKELGEKKINFSDEYKSLDDLRLRNFNKYIEYNVHDVRLVVRLDEKLQFIRQAMTIAYDAKVNLQDVFGSVRMWDVMIHNYLLDQKVAVPPMPSVDPNARGVEGAFVKDPQCGRQRCVASFDLTSLYPHLIMQYNISPDTYRGRLDEPHTIDQILAGSYERAEVKEWHEKNCTVSAAGVAFTKEKQGFLPALMERLFADRSRFKKEMLKRKQELENTDPKDTKKRDALSAEIQRLDAMQQAKKIQLNSAYGALGNSHYRWYRRELAESITLSGQLSIRWMEKWLNKFLNKLCKTVDHDFVIAIDTDSLYLNLEKVVQIKFGPDIDSVDRQELIKFMDEVSEKVITPQINKGYQALADYMSAYAQKMHMKREALADVAYWVGKKRYAINVYNHEGVQFAEPKLKMTGLDAVRSSTPKYIKGVLKEGFRILMTGTEQELQEMLAAARLEFRKQPFSQLSRASTANGLAKYRAPAPQLVQPACPIHVRGAILYNWWIEENKLNHLQPIFEGDKIKFVYLRLPNPLRHNVISVPSGEMPSDLGLEQYIDYDAQFDKMIVHPLQNAADFMHWSTVKRASLASFFS